MRLKINNSALFAGYVICPIKKNVNKFGTSEEGFNFHLIVAGIWNSLVGRNSHLAAQFCWFWILWFGFLLDLRYLWNQPSPMSIPCFVPNLLLSPDLEKQWKTDWCCYRYFWCQRCYILCLLLFLLKMGGFYLCFVDGVDYECAVQGKAIQMDIATVND